MAEDRGIIVSGFDQLLASPVDEFDTPLNVGGDQWVYPNEFDSLGTYALAVGHWSYSVRFTNYPPIPEVLLSWVYSYIPPAEINALELGDRSLVPGVSSNTEYGVFNVDQDRWLTPDGVDTHQPGNPCLIDPADVDPYRVYPPTSPFELVFRLCYAPPLIVSCGEDHRGLIVYNKGSEFLETGEIVLGREDYFQVEEEDTLVIGDVCALRELPSLFWGLYPPQPSIDFLFVGCYAPPRAFFDSGPVVIDYSTVYDREALVVQNDSLETGPILASPTQFVEVEESEHLGTSLVCVTAPYASRWYTYPPPFPVEIVFRCSYRRPRAHDQYGPITVSAIYEIQPLAPAFGVSLAGSDQLVTSLLEVTASWSPSESELLVTEVDSFGYGLSSVELYERLITPFDTETLETGVFGLENTNQTTRVRDTVSLEIGEFSLSLWENVLTPVGIDLLGVDPIWPRADLADRIIELEPVDALLSGELELFIPVPIEPFGLDSFTDRVTSPDIAMFVSEWDRHFWVDESIGLSTGTIVIGTDQELPILWSSQLETGSPWMIRYQELDYFGGTHSQYDLPTLISWEAIEVHGLDSFEQVLPILGTVDREIGIDQSSDSAYDPPIVETDKFVVFKDYIDAQPSTQYGTNRLSNVDRELPIDVSESLETSVDTFIEKTPAAIPDELDSTQHGQAWVSFANREITPSVYIPPRQSVATVKNDAFAPVILEGDSLEVGPSRVILGERFFGIDGLDSTQNDQPLIGFEREVMVPRGFQWHFEEYGQLAIGHREQLLGPNETDQSIQGYEIFLKEVFSIAEVRTYKVQETEYEWSAVGNVDRFREVPGPDSLIFGLPGVHNEVSITQPYGLDSLSLGLVQCIWARPETLDVGARYIPETEYGWWRIDNELVGAPVTQIVSMWLNEDLEEVIPSPLTAYGGVVVGDLAIIPDELDSLQKGEIWADGHLIELFEGSSYFRAGSPRVEYFHRSLDVDTVTDEELALLIDEPRVDPAYIIQMNGEPLTNANHDGTDSRVGRKYDPSPPSIANEHQGIGVTSANDQFQYPYPSYGEVGIGRGFGLSLIDIEWKTHTQFGDLEIWPHTRRCFVSDMASWQLGDVLVEQGIGIVIPGDQWLRCSSGDVFLDGATVFENQHRDIVVSGIEHTIFGDNDPMVHFERGFDVDPQEQFIGGLPWVSADPQEPLIDTETDCLEPYSEYNEQTRVSHVFQLMEVVGPSTFDSGVPKMTLAPTQ